MIKVGDTLRMYSIELNIDGDVKKEKEEYPVVAAKEYTDYSKKKKGQYIVLDDDSYAILQTIDQKYSIHSILNKVNVYERKWCIRSLKDYISANVTTSETDDKKVYKKLKKEIEKYLQSNYGRYGNYIDLLNNIEI
ncbi:hypothetical protein [Clostridium botulinum]|uniref:hypothetical protein n=1 Tax=Clostridium botulinum TaxID=1491 RepID=UPI00077359E5|nr:hypothetical protein [Clostridium botulinum]NFG37511.1 hypothetical protein [Clostridium botulinum]NFO48180.1 hypothetical protein [Clostridium botulinum]